jgi:hypothetical protein
VVCETCGADALGHVVMTGEDPRGHTVTKLLGPVDGHLFVARRPRPVAPPAIQEDDMTVLARIQQLNTSRMDVDEMVQLLTDARAVRGTYEEKELPVPEQIVEGINTLDTAINLHAEDSVKKRLREIAAQRTSLESRDDKLGRLNEEEARLKARLGRKEPVTA